MNTIETPELVKKYFKRPFRYDGQTYIWDANNNMCLDHPHNAPKSFFVVLVKILNGKNIPLKFNSNIVLADGDFIYNNEPILRVRGWGRLQQIKTDDPVIIQDTFAKWVLDLILANTVQ